MFVYKQIDHIEVHKYCCCCFVIYIKGCQMLRAQPLISVIFYMFQIHLLWLVHSFAILSYLECENQIYQHWTLKVVRLQCVCTWYIDSWYTLYINLNPCITNCENNCIDYTVYKWHWFLHIDWACKQPEYVIPVTQGSVLFDTVQIWWELNS